MKILHICNISNSPFSGISVVVPQHIQAQSRICDVLVLNLNGKMIDSDAKQVTIDYLYSESFCVDLVVFHGVYFIEYVKIGKFLTKKNIPYIVFPHGSLTKTSLHQKRLKKILANLIFFSKFLKKATALQFLTDKEKETSVFSEKGFVCGNGVSISEIEKKYSISNNCNKFIYVGRFDIFHKGIDLLLDAIELEKDFLIENKFRLNMYGPRQKAVQKKESDIHECIKNMITNRRIGQLVQIHDAIYGEQKIETLKKSDVFIQTSRFEGLPLGILEALSIGLPCLVTEGTNLSELVNKYNAGWGVETTSRKIADAIKFVISKISGYQLTTYSGAAIQLVKENFTWSKIAEKEIFMYRGIVERTKRE